MYKYCMNNEKYLRPYYNYIMTVFVKKGTCYVPNVLTTMSDLCVKTLDMMFDYGQVKYHV